MEINGKKVVDATKPISIHITARDAIDGANKDPAGCAAARAVKRDLHCVSARVHIGRVYVETPKQWVRYHTPRSLRTEIIAFDRGGSFEPGEYKLGVPENRRVQVEKRPGRTGTHKNESRRRRKVLIAKIKRHEVTGIRPKGANR